MLKIILSQGLVGCVLWRCKTREESMYELFEHLYKGRKEDTITELMAYCLTKNEKDAISFYCDITASKREGISYIETISQCRIKTRSDKRIRPDLVLIAHDSNDKPISQAIIECKIEASFGDKAEYEVFNQKFDQSKSHLVILCPSNKKDKFGGQCSPDGFKHVVTYNAFINRFEDIDDHIVKSICKFIRENKDNKDRYNYLQDLSQKQEQENSLDDYAGIRKIFNAIQRKAEKEVEDLFTDDVLHLSSYDSERPFPEEVFFTCNGLEEAYCGQSVILEHYTGSRLDLPHDYCEDDLIYYPEGYKLQKDDQVRLSDVYNIVSEIDRRLTNSKKLNKYKINKNWDEATGIIYYDWDINQTAGLQIAFSEMIPLLTLYIDSDIKERFQSYDNILNFSDKEVNAKCKDLFDEDCGECEYYSYNTIDEFVDNFEIIYKFFEKECLK